MARRKFCHKNDHVADCRPARPLCYVMRKVQREKYGVCFCSKVHFPHRRSYCERGGADRYAFGFSPEPPPDGDAREPHEAVRSDDAVAFFDDLAAGRRSG